jgi:two-component system phosphate regulon sensor histidine kinase PhoR
MDQNARRLVALVEDLLTIGRIEAGSFDSERAPLDLGPMIEAAGTTMLPTARTKGVVLEVDVSPLLGVVSADAGQIDRVLLNLISNALKFTKKNGRVTVTARPTPIDEVVITVEDNGVGIPISEQGQVFSRFFRAHQTVVDAVPGTGLGLAIVKSIVDQHDGRIALVSEPGHGTTVTVTLPRALQPDLVLTEDRDVQDPATCTTNETRHDEQHRIGS